MRTYKHCFIRPAFMAPFLFILIAIGCGKKDTAEVKGKVTYKGDPLPSGRVTFIGPQGKAAAFAEINSQGEYLIREAPLGPVQITVTVPAEAKARTGMEDVIKGKPKKDQKMPGFDNEGSEAKVIPIPPDYGKPEKSGLKYEVKTGSQTHDIKLE